MEDVRKLCSKCGESKTVDYFYASKRAKDGLRSSCKLCTLKENEDSKRRHPEASLIASRNWRMRNVERSRAYGRSYWKRDENRQKAKDNQRRYRSRNPEVVRATVSRSAKKRSAEVNQRRQERLRSDPHFRIRQRFGSMFSRRMKRHSINKNGTSCFDCLPYTVAELIRHIESAFMPGMNWSNYGLWHIDHKRPDSSFVYSSTNDQGFMECWSLSNLQPLWAQDNMRKSNRLHWATS